MTEAIYTAASGALAHQLTLEVLANNLSNVNTVGFKADTVSFRSYYPEQVPLQEDGTVDPLSAWVTDLYDELQSTQIDFSSGALEHTGNPLDLALAGNGFFTVETDTCPQYTRKGSFTLSPDGVLVTQEGLPVLGQNGPITITEGSVQIDSEGNVSVAGAQVDKLRVVEFPEPYPLEKTQDTLFRNANPEVPAEDATAPMVEQGYLERSNVNPVKVMTQMIEALRAYESYQKAIQAIDEANSEAINEVGVVT